MERLTHEADFGLEEWEQTLYSVNSDQGGAYNILDIASHEGEDEFDEILKTISLGLKHYEDTGLTPEQIVEQTNAGWIPVEERLPEDYSQVMVSMYDLGWITIGTYSSHSKLWKVNSYITGLGVDVRAWRPLPDPYRPEVTKP